MPWLFALAGSTFCSAGAWCGLECQGTGPLSVGEGAGEPEEVQSSWGSLPSSIGKELHRISCAIFKA